MKRRFRCRDCGREGPFGSFQKRRRSPWPGWARRLMNLHGTGICRNRIACADRKGAKDDRRRAREAVA